MNEGTAYFDPVAQWAFNVQNIHYDAYKVQADLVYTDILDNQVPKDTFSPGLVPGVF